MSSSQHGLSIRSRLTSFTTLLMLLGTGAAASAADLHIVLGRDGATPTAFTYRVATNTCLTPTRLPTEFIGDTSGARITRYIANASNGPDVVVVVDSTPIQFCGRTILPLSLTQTEALKINARGGDDVVWGGDFTNPTQGPLFGTIARFTIDGGSGNDTIYGGAAIEVFGGTGDDQILGFQNGGYFDAGAGTGLICTQVDGVFASWAFGVDAIGGFATLYGSSIIVGSTAGSSISVRFDTATRDRCSLSYLAAALTKQSIFN